MFKHKDMMPHEFNKLSKEEKLLLNVFINYELDERFKQAKDSEIMPVISI